MGRYYLVDGTNLLYRAYHALQAFRTSRGLPTHAVFGFTSMIFRVLREHAPEAVAVVFDPPGPTQKHELYAEYKATREKTPDDLAVQIPYVHRILKALGLPVLLVQGYEADDVLGTLARRLSEEGHEVTLVTGDKDFCQLVGRGVRLLDTMKDRLTGPEEVREKFGVEPGRFVDLLSLTGDLVDNLPGVPGVGVKTAAQLLNRYGTLEEVVARAGEEKGKRGEALRAHGARALSNRALVTIDTHVPIPVDAQTLLPGPRDRAALADVLRELEFHRFLKDLELLSEPSEKPMGETAGRAEISVPEGWVALLPGTKDEPWAVAAANGAAEAFALDDPEAHWPESFRRALDSSEVAVVGHGLKAACLALRARGFGLTGIHLDCEVAGYLLDPGRRAYGLEDLARDRGVAFPARTEPAEDARARARGALVVARTLERELDEAGLLDLYRRVENPLIPILADMQYAGVRIDTAALAAMSLEYGQRLRTLEDRMFELAGERFSPQSPKQLGRVLFEKLKLPSGRKTATGYSTDASVLEELALVHPLPSVLLEHRSLAKLKGTFIDALPALVDPSSGRIHAKFHQTVTATGRLSSSDPNLQNIPVRGEEGRRIREAFTAEEGFGLLSADYSQVELRILAHLSQDPALLEIFRAGRDVHSETASRIFNVGLSSVDPRMRREAKTVNFGILYGISAFGLARQLGIGRDAASRMIEAYFHQFPGVRSYLDRLIDEARSTGYARTLFGRRRAIPEIRSRNRAQREFGERAAVNTPIQGTAADIIKLAMVNSVQRVDAAKMEARLILQVHDELVFEVAEDQAEDARTIVKQAMETAAQLSVPLSADAGWGRNWYLAH